LLLVIVLGIWGSIAYKLINGISPNIQNVMNQDSNIGFKPNKRAEIDTFFITPVERDPFLGVLTNNINKEIKVKTDYKPKTSHLSISYSGMVSNSSAKDKVFIVNIEGTQYLIKKGQTIASVKLIKGNIDEILVSYNNKTLIVKRQ